MTTGLHTVRDVMCDKCGTTLGWKYGQSLGGLEARLVCRLEACVGTNCGRAVGVFIDKAYELSQKYKEGE